MLVKIIKTPSRLADLLKLFFIRKVFMKNSTFVGDGPNLYPSSRISLEYGSTKDDVILHEHCEVYGRISSINHGKIIIHDWVKFGFRTIIEAVNYIEIGRDTAIANDVTIIDNNNHPINPDDRRYMRHTKHGAIERSHHISASAPIVIGENVWIGSSVRICKGVTIGDNAIIAASSVVTHDVPANAVAAGNPAKIVKTDIDKSTKPIFPLK